MARIGQEARPQILIVDDMLENILVLDEILKPFYRRSVSRDGEGALRLAGADEPPDLILLDINMPGLNGYEVCRRLKAEPRTREIPVIFVTARDEAGDEAHGFEIGGVDYITKPVSPPVVLARVRTHLKLREALQASEERRRFTQDAAGAFTFEWDLVTKRGFWSEELYTLFGLENRHEPPSYALWRESILPEDRDSAEQKVSLAVEAGAELDAEWRVPDGQGGARWLMARGKPMRDDTGRVTRYVGVVMDITQRKQIEATLRQWADAFESCAHGLAIGRPGSERLLVCNPAYARMLGSTPEKIAGQPILDNYDPAEHDYVQACIATADQYGEMRYETVMRRADGSTFPVQMDLVSVRDAAGRVMYRVGTAQDITERKRDQDALAWEAAMRAATAELARAIIAADNLEAVSTLVLDSAQRLTHSRHGYVSYIEEGTDLVMVPCWSDGVLQQCCLPRNQLGFLHFMGFTDQAMRGRKPLVSNDLAADERAGGQPVGHIPIKNLLCVPALVGERLVGHIVVGNSPRDFTDKDVNLLQRLADIYALAVTRIRVDEQLHNEEVARRSAEEANRAKGEFLATVSHEVRTPLHNIMGTVQTLRRLVARKRLTDQVRDEMLQDIEVASRHLAGIIEDILEVSRIEAGRIEVELGPVDLAEMPERLQASLGGVAAAKGLALEIALDQDLPAVKGDPKRLTQVLINLAGNAIKFTSQGGVRVEAAVVEGAPAVVRVDVADTGPGIPPERQGQIFERFERLDASGSIPGAGLGLAICRKLVEMMNGRIWLDSELGRGTTFHFTVPVWED